MRPRIDTLDKGARVVLEIDGSYKVPTGYTREMIFREITGTGNHRQAFFTDLDGKEWVLFRYMGRWAYGEEKGKIRLLNVIE